MLKDNRVIVTKRRYSGPKVLMIILLFSVEFFALFMNFFTDNDRAVFAFAAYVVFVFMFLGKTNSSKTYLKYEYILGLIIKTVVMNVIIWLYMVSLVHEQSMIEIVIRMICITGMNIISIIIVFLLGNVYARVRFAKENKVIHIYPEAFDGYDCLESGVEAVKKEIEDYEYVYLHHLSSRSRKRLLKYCYEHDKTVYCTANLSDVLLKASGLTQDVDSPVYYCTSFGISGISALLKRAFDIFFSLGVLIVTSPILLITALCIKIEDGGSAIYKQVRCTKNMKQFTIYKFRSMTENSEGAEAKLAVSDDQRLTKVGKIIRKFKIDELPQFVNILKGDMSVVGPRPERPELIEVAIKKTPEFVLRTKVKAGLTGYAQVRGYYDTKFRDKLLWDLMYIENFSLLLDLKIIIMTVFTVFSENMRDE